MKMNYTTKMNYTQAGSMITVVPKPIVKLFEFHSGDKLEWNVEFKDNGATITVQKKD